MNYSTAIFLISADVRAVVAVYEAHDNAPRTMFKTLDQDIKVGDFVVVPSSTRHKMTTCKIVEVDVEPDLESSDDVVWVIGTVKTEDFEDLKAKEDDAITKIKSAEKRRKREELRAALENDVGEEALKALPFNTSRNETKEDSETDPA